MAEGHTSWDCLSRIRVRAAVRRSCMGRRYSRAWHCLQLAAGGNRSGLHRLEIPGGDCRGISAGGQVKRLPTCARTGAFQKRQRNVRAALERIIEKAGEVDVTASAVIAAVQAYAKINSAGEWIDRAETVSMNDLFDRMSTEELEGYAQTGTLPEWFKATVGTTE